MAERKYRLHSGKKGAALGVRVIPRSRKNEITEILNDGTVKIRLIESADDQRLNQSLLAFMSDVLGVPQDRMEIVAGSTGLDKLVSILDLDAASVQRRILEKLS